MNLGWTAPSSNTDGSQLTDLASYRIYYTSASGACGSATAQTLPAPIPNPIPGTVVSYSLNGLSTGSTYFVQVSAVDTGGNESACSNQVSAAAQADGADTTAPTGSVTLNSGAAYTNWTAATLSLSSTDAVGVTGYYVASSATVPTAGAAGWVAVTATTSYSNATVPFTLPAGDGTKTVYAWYKDAAGNVSGTASDTIVLDQTAPTNGTLTATAGAWQVALSWAGVTDGGSGLATATPYKLVFQTGSSPASTCSTGTQIYQGTGTSYTHTGLTAGTVYYYRVCATDKAGNISTGATASATPQVGTDTTPPTVSITSPTTGATYSTGTSPLTLGGTAADNVGVSQVTWSNDRGGSGTASGTSTWSAPGIPLQSGSNVLTVTAADAAGNTARATLTVTYTPPDLTTGLEAAYSFNEGSGTLLQDVSGKGRHGTVSGATWVAGKWGTALNFNAYSQYVALPTSIPTGGPFTLAAWVQRANLGNTQHHILARCGPSWVAGCKEWYFAGTGQYRYGTNRAGDTTGSTVQDTAWHFVAVVQTATQRLLYVDGTQVGSSSLGPDADNANPLELGRIQVTGEFFGGVIDELRIYSRALSAADLQAAMATPVAAGPPPDTTAPAGSLTINANATTTNTNSVTVSLAATDAVGVTGYYVSTSATVPTAGAAGWVAVTATTSYSNANVPFTIPAGDGSKTVYAWFKDAAGNVSGTTSDSILLDTTPPSDGTLTATPGSGQLVLNWTGFVDSGSGLAATNPYKLVFATGSTPPASCTSGTQLSQGSGTSYTHTGLTSGTTYAYRVCATDGAGNTSAGATASAAPQAADTTAPTGSIRINSGSTATNAPSVTLTLTATDAVGVTGYYVSSSATVPAAGASGWVAVTATPSYTNATVPFTLPAGDGLKPVYAWFKDAAGNVSGTSSAAITLDQTAPTNGSLTATAGTGQVALNWTGFADAASGLAPTSPYVLVFATGSSPAASCTNGTQLYQGTATSYTHTGLAAGTTYVYRLCATDAAGNVSTGATASATPQAVPPLGVPPAVTTLTAPAGAISNNTPTYTWTAVASATWYYLWVNDASGSGKVLQWVTAGTAGCGGGTGNCSFTPSAPLAPGSATWWVQTWNDAGYGPWSSGKAFTVPAIGVPPAVTGLTGPVGVITTATPTYTWNAVPTATWYYLWVTDSTGVKIQQWYPASAIGCASGRCSVTPGTALAAGGGQWWVQTWNDAGYGPWSSGVSFTRN